MTCVFYEKIIADLLKNPESSIKQDQIKTAIASHLEDNPKDEAFLKEMYEVLNEKAGRGEGISIVNSKNVNTGNVNTGGGDFILGDGHARK